MTPVERIPQTYEQRAHVTRMNRRRSHGMLEREIERLSARIADLEREKASVEAFAALAAHELVEPLVMTEAYAAMVSDRLDERQHAESLRDLDALSRSAVRVRLLVETMLHDARTTGRNLRLEEVDLNVLVADCVAMLMPQIVARGARIEIGELPVVRGEEALLTGVFTNLLANALKYGRREGSLIRVSARTENGDWRFAVDSEGPTIPVEDRERIFEPFNRGTGERRSRGAGLGLAITRRIVERHGGRVGVTATNGSGNSFFFTLPAR
jgi:light-regulated signal transduction histidine kinase (bacteriophytochrome)